MHSRVLDPCTIIRVQSWDIQAPTPARVKHALETTWPRTVGTVMTGRADVLCIGPTEWLVLASDPDPDPLFRILNEGFQGSAFRRTNVSSALSRIEIGGPNVQSLLSKGCSLDLHPQMFSPERSARTRFAGMPVVLHCTQPTTFECIVSLSLRDYFLSWLADAAMEF
jgi:sarcosine oxidase subunit gamma